MRFFALTTATADLPEVPDIQESLTAIQKFIKTASPVVLNALWHIALALVIFFVGRWLLWFWLTSVCQEPPAQSSQTQCQAMRLPRPGSG